MNLDIFPSLIAAVTYFTLSLMHDMYRRRLEQFFAEEILSARGASEETVRREFSRRMQNIQTKERALRWTIRYGFPVSKGAVLALFDAAVLLTWPLQIFVSVRGYVIDKTNNDPCVEICNDANIRVKAGR